MKIVVDESTLNWEWYMAPLMFYNRSYHRTIDTSLYKLTYGLKPTLPSFPAPQFNMLNYGEGFVDERLQLLKKAKYESRRLFQKGS
jgi:hypothetical protein